MAGMRTVSIRFTGDTKGLDKAAANAEKSVGRVRSAVESAGRMAAPAAAAAAATLGAVMAPALAGALAGGVVLALGGGFLAAGIMAAAQDPGVSKAFSGLADRAKAAFKDFGKPFIEPLKRAADTFGDALERMAPTINKVGATLAPLIDKLAPAIAQMAENALPGIASAAERAAPAFEKLAGFLPTIGTWIGNIVAKFGELAVWAAENSAKIGEFISVVAPIVGIFMGIIGAIKIWIAVQTALNIVMSLNPIGLIIIAVAALIAVIVVIATKTRFFQTVWAGAWSGIKSAASAVGSWFKDTLWNKWIKGAWEAIVNKGKSVLSWFQSLPGKIKSAVANIADFLTAPFRNAFNAIARLWNATVGQLSWTVPGWVPGIGGNSISVPRLPERASGGPVLAGRSYLVGERGPEVLTMGGSGGRITPNRELGGGVTITGDLVFPIDLGNGVQQVIRINNRDLKRRAMATGAAR